MCDNRKAHSLGEGLVARCVTPALTVLVLAEALFALLGARSRVPPVQLVQATRERDDDEHDEHGDLEDVVDHATQ